MMKTFIMMNGSSELKNERRCSLIAEVTLACQEKGGGQSKYVVFGKRSVLNEGVGACTSKSLLHQAHQHTNSLLFKTKSTLFFYLANVYM